MWLELVNKGEKEKTKVGMFGMGEVENFVVVVFVLRVMRSYWIVLIWGVI